MRVRIFALTLIIVFALKSFSSDWEIVRTAGDIKTTSKGYFINSTTGFLVYDDGIVMKTFDGGQTWEKIRESDGSNLDWNDIEFANENIGYACGNSGIIYKTVDGGNNWEQVGDTATYRMDLKCLSVVNESVVFFGGKDSTVLKTVDGGNSYIKMNYNFEGQDIDGGIAFCDENVGVAISDSKGGYTFYTHDGGESWHCVRIDTLFPPGAITSKLYAISAGGDSTIFIGGYPYCGFLSENGGRSYKLVTPYTSSFEFLKSVDVVNENTIIAGGSSGYLIITRDGGENWDTLKTSSGQNVELVTFPDEDTGFVFQSSGQWYKTEDGGESFVPINSWPALIFYSIETTGNGKIIVTSFGGGEIAVSNDSGLSWEYPSNLKTKINENLYDCEFLNSSIGYITGSRGNILKTEDGGKNWHTLGSPFSELYNRNFYAIDHQGDTVVIVGSSGYLFVSHDGGNSWIGDQYTSGNMNDVCIISDSQIVTVGTGGKVCIAKIANDTVYFDEDLNADRKTLNAVDFRGDIGIIVNSTGSIFRTTVDEVQDTAYNVFSDPDGSCLNDVEFVTDSLVFVAGRNGKIYKSENGGLYWELMPIPQDIEDVEFRKLKYDYNRLWAVGTKGTIMSMLLYENKVHRPIVSIANEFEVYQNYPNPFNASTVISFKIPMKKSISVYIYNMLGENVRTLMNNELCNEGFFSVIWDGKDDRGNNLPSGVYFYKVSSDTKVQTRRMLLLK